MQIQNNQEVQLISLLPEKEDVFCISANYTPVGADETIKKSCTCYFAPGASTFSAFGKLTAAFGAVNPEEIKIQDPILTFRPYWRVKGLYACRYKRRHSHKLLLEDDVEAVTIYGKDQYVVQEKHD